MSTYATDFYIEHAQQRRIRTLSRQSQAVLRQTFLDLINASRRFYNADTPVVRPHQFQVPLHDTHQEIIELLYLLAEDACDNLNLYPKPPESDARRIVFTMAHRIQHLTSGSDELALVTICADDNHEESFVEYGVLLLSFSQIYFHTVWSLDINITFHYIRI